MSRLRIKEVIYTVTTAYGSSDPWSGGGNVPAGGRATAVGNPAHDNFLARRMLVPSPEVLRWCLLSLEVVASEGEVSDRLILDGGARIGCLTEPGAPEFALRVPQGSRVRAEVENLEACQFVFRLTLVGPICDSTWKPRHYS